LKNKVNIMKNIKRERFEKIASNRVQIILDTLTRLGNCSNKNNYDYSKEDIEKIFKTLKEKLRETEIIYASKLSKMNQTNFKI
jgi:hypothetical protein